MGEAALWFPYKAVRIGSRLRVYNLETDPWEEEDLAASRAEICRMAEELFLKEWAVMTIPEEARRKPEE